MKKITILILLVSTMFSCKYENEENLYKETNCDTENLSYATNIEEIISTSCAVSGCHVSGTGRHIYDSYSNIKADVDNGSILERVVTNKTMPPGGNLSECDNNMINEWIIQGSKE